MSRENRIHVRWDGRLYPEVESSDVRRFFASFGPVIELDRKNNWKKGRRVRSKTSLVVCRFGLVGIVPEAL